MPHIIDFIPLDIPILSLLQNVEEKKTPESEEHRQGRTSEGDGAKQPAAKNEAGKGGGDKG